MKKSEKMDATRNNEARKEEGFFGEFGGSFVPEGLKPALSELKNAYFQHREDQEFQDNLYYYLKENVGRPTPLYFAERLTKKFGGAKIYLKREDLNHMGAHKINNTLGQCLLAKRMGKNRLVAETGAGQHGVATATAAAMFGLECEIFMGKKDVERQELNAYRMKLLGAEVNSVTEGNAGLAEAVDAALEYWVENLDDTYYLLGSAVGPHPYPTMVRDFQSVIGEEVKEQISQKENRMPDYLLACVGGGSNAIGLFHPFLEEEGVEFIGLEAGGKSSKEGEHAATLTEGKPGVKHGFKSYLLQSEDGEASSVHSLAAGLDYPGVGPEHSYMKETGRASYEAVTDEEALAAFHELSELEGIIPALESSHALAYLSRLAPKLDREKIIVVNLSGRGDKDVRSTSELLDI